MPVAVPRTPFPEPGSPSPIKLRVPQARILSALMPQYPGQPPFDWPICTRAGLLKHAGYEPTSGVVNRALGGILSLKSGKPHLGMLALKLIEEVVLDIEGVSETNYRTTVAGIDAYRAYIAQVGALPPLRDKKACTNNRYKKNSENP